jgi:hypothetical protein
MVVPGHYLLRAVANGFDTGEYRALVAANRETVLDTFMLRRSDTLADRRRNGGRDYRNAARSSRRHVFHLDQTPEAARDREDAAQLVDNESRWSTHGVVETVAVSGDSDYVATNFAVTHQVKGSNVTVVGQTGIGENVPQRFEALTETGLGDAHQLAIAFGYGRLLAADGGPDLNQFSVRVVDRWQVWRPLALVYGLEYARLSGASDSDSLLPYLGLEFTATARTQFFARLAPGSTPEVESFDLETGRVTFREAQVAPAAASEEVTPDRSRRLQLGIGHIIDERSNVEVVAFFDVVSGRGIGVLAVPAGGVDARFTTGELTGRTSGLRVVYTRQLTHSLEATFGYSAGNGLALASTGPISPADMVDQSFFQVLAARLEARFDTGTRLTAYYRITPRAIIFAIDPFDGRLDNFAPTASFVVSQPLPDLDFLPGQWEARLDVRNLLDQRPCSDDGDFIVTEAGRLVRAGFAVRF